MLIFVQKLPSLHRRVVLKAMRKDRATDVILLKCWLEELIFLETNYFVSSVCQILRQILNYCATGAKNKSLA